MGNCCEVSDEAQVSWSLGQQKKRSHSFQPEVEGEIPSEIDKMNNPTVEAKKIFDKLGLYKELPESTKDKIFNIPISETTYKGEMTENLQRHGIGYEIPMNGEVYSGHFKNNKRHGKGRLIFPDGDYYEGDFENDLPHGIGILIETDGYTHEGEFHKGVKQGPGKETSPKKDVLEGTWIKGEIEGEGTWTFADGSLYEGSFSKGKCHGKGKFFYAKGAPNIVYEGDYYEGKRHGEGVLKMANGYVYHGQFSLDKLSGIGKLMVPEKGTFEGGFVNGKRDGIFEFTGVDRKVKKIEYDMDKRVKVLE